jgi:predicted phage terminase large subunit-like protein
VTTAAVATADLAPAVRRGRAIRREMLRRLVLEGDPKEALCRLCVDVLGLVIKPFHEKLVDFDLGDEHESMSLAPRGFGKSTVLTVARCILEVLRNPNIRILIASKTAGRASDFLSEITGHLRFNDRLTWAFGPQFDHDRVFREGLPWSNTAASVAGRTILSKEPTFSTTGVGGQVAGAHYDLILGDDLVAEENSRTEGQRAKLSDWYGKVLYPTIDADITKLRFRGTRYHPLDLWGEFIENDMPTLIVPAIGGDGESAWPEKFPTTFLEDIRKRRGSAIFASQYMNETDLMKGAMFREEWFRYWKTPPSYVDEDGNTRSDFENSDAWLGGDPAATGKEVLLTARKANSDWWTFAVAARNVEASGEGYEPEFYFRYLWRGRVTKREYLERVVSTFKRFNCVLVAMENNAQQEHLCQDLEAIVPVRRVTRTVDKVSRAFALQPYFENGQILFPHESLLTTDEERETWRALRDELMLFPDAGVHDDLFDAIETTVRASTEGAIEVFSV